MRIAKRGVWSLKEARDILTRLVGSFKDWTALDQFLIDYHADAGGARDGDRQLLRRDAGTGARGACSRSARTDAFAPIYLRSRTAPQIAAEGAS